MRYGMIVSDIHRPNPKQQTIELQFTTSSSMVGETHTFNKLYKSLPPNNVKPFIKDVKSDLELFGSI